MPEWDTIEDRSMINAFSYGPAGGAWTDRRLHTGGRRNRRDEHHAGLGHGAHPRDRPAQSSRARPRHIWCNSCWKRWF